MENSSFNCIIILGPTAVGKTSIGVAIANHFNGEIISADSRQTYKKLDIGSGKDLQDYYINNQLIPYHLIDIISLPDEYTVYDYQKDFYKAFSLIQSKNKIPVVVGGTGMYLDSIIRDYSLVNIPENKELHNKLMNTPLEELSKKLLSIQPDLHVMADLQEKSRVVKALEILDAKEKGFDTTSSKRPFINPLIIGTTLPRPILWENISKRLKERLDNGMLQEVSFIHDDGISWERLEKLGLEYKYCSLFLQGKISTKEELFETLFIKIRQFAKRQETWFRMMEKKGVKIHWLNQVFSKEERISSAIEYISSQNLQ